ncbi:2-hydroxyacid dehydrogenase [Arthrobacter roseus]|uniref:2-hydroxyacid dehydrogenase n=1 Tax=Arthrobacter roseus TaxID=136274 RepID=UPI0019647D99|nr:2-hydroxyacid dehydrogenase [Arthrobacter roseus]MBM7848943.1 phosphoglycerate dehydrogenase-like enzyme [Arthrobacter roseus]
MARERIVQTLTVPTPELLEALSPHAGQVRLGLWDLKSAPVGLSLGEIDGVVLPYANGADCAPALSRIDALKFVQTQSTGYEGLPEIIGPAVGLASAAGVHAAATAELAVGLVLASQRGIAHAVRDQGQAAWNHRRYPGLADKRVLLIGVGGIGREIARRLDPFEVELARVGSRARNDDDGTVHGPDDLVALAEQTDVLIIITPLTEATRKLIGAEVLGALPDGALVVNVARGGVVDSEALTREVVAGRLRAALDVFDPEPLPADHPLWGADGVIITPHTGGNTEAFDPRIRALLRRQLEALNNGRSPENLVQSGPFPAV